MPDPRNLFALSEGMSTGELLFGLFAAGFGLLILKAVLTPGGRKGNWGQSKVMVAPWVIVPLLVAICVGIGWMLLHVMHLNGGMLQS